MSSLKTNIENLAIRIGTELKTIRQQLTGQADGSLDGLATTNKQNLVNAINELKGLINNFPAPASILIDEDDFSSNTDQLAPTQQSTKAYVANQIQILINNSPEALDTLNEIATALGNDPDFSATIMSALGLRLRVDSEQGLNSTQKATARNNINVYSKNEIGDPQTDFVTVFQNALM